MEVGKGREGKEYWGENHDCVKVLRVIRVTLRLVTFSQRSYFF